MKHTIVLITKNTPKELYPSHLTSYKYYTLEIRFFYNSFDFLSSEVQLNFSQNLIYNSLNFPVTYLCHIQLILNLYIFIK